jgi:hypothetical protein
MTSAGAGAQMGTAPDGPQHLPSVQEVKDVASVEARQWAKMRLEYVGHEHRIGKAINRIANDEFYPYLNEAWRCFRSDAYNSALVFLWCAMIRYLQKFVSMDGRKEVFEFEYERKKKKRLPEDITDVNDGEFLDFCCEMGFISVQDSIALCSWLKSLRKRRNDLAHCDWLNETKAAEVVEAIERVVDHIFQVPVEKQQWGKANSVLFFVKGREKPIPKKLVSELVQSVPEQQRINLCHQLLRSYQSGEGAANLKNIGVIWTEAFLRFDTVSPQSIVKRGIEQIAGVLRLDAIQSKGEWRFQPWPKMEGEDTELEPRDEAELDIEDRARNASALLSLWLKVSSKLEPNDIVALDRLRELQQQIEPLARPIKGTNDGK